MPSLKPYTLHFKGGLHLGTRGINLSEASEFIPSDTLFAALLDVWNRLGKSVDNFVEPYRHDENRTPNPPFLLTSAFPFAGNIRFYPVPTDPERIFSADILNDPELRKSLRKIRYFSEKLLQKAFSQGIQRSDLFSFSESDVLDSCVTLQEGKIWLLKKEVVQFPKHLQRDKERLSALQHLKIWQQGEVPRVTIDRIAQASSLYHAGRVTFAEGCGLWFGVHWRNETNYHTNAFTTALHALQDDGIGGERSSGYGAFTLNDKLEKFDLPDAKAGEIGYLLSRYHPAADELPDALNDAPKNAEDKPRTEKEKRTAYKLVNVGGWLHTHGEADQRRRRLWMVEAGSLVYLKKDVQGSLEDVQPNYANEAGDLSHAVWRYGFALSIGGFGKKAEVK